MRITAILLSLALLLLTGCSANPGASPTSQAKVPPSPAETAAAAVYDRNSEDSVIYLAGGCFWGMQKYLQTIPGVTRTVVGYANGQWDKETPPTYEDVSTGRTGFRETVYVEYDPEQVSLDTILFAYFYVIDPTVQNRQGADFGSEYQTGIYYTNEATKAAIDRITAIEAERYTQILVEIEPLEVFYEAEEYHQNYLEKNPNGVCHINQ